MVQLKTTSQKREDGKGNADNVGNKGGTRKSSSAAASALSPAAPSLGRTSLSKPPSKGKGSSLWGKVEEVHQNHHEQKLDMRLTVTQ
jgi:hypothetical protein